MHLAAKYGHTRAVALLSKLGEKRKKDVTHAWDAKAFDAEASSMLRAASFSKTGLAFPDDFYATKNFTARELAIMFGHRESALAFPRYRGHEMQIAFSCACLTGDLELVQEFWRLQNGFWERAGLKSLAEYTYLPLPLAMISGNIEIVSLLLKEEFQGKFGWSADWAARSGSVPILKLMASLGANLASTHSVSLWDQRTALSHAIEYDR